MPGTIIGEWTQAAHRTLKKIAEETAKGKYPRQKDMDGSERNWSYALVKAGYFKINDQGFEITTKGKMLLEELNNNPPERRRKKKGKQTIPTKSIPSKPKIPSKTADIEVIFKAQGGSTTRYLTSGQVFEVMNFIDKMLKK